MAIYKKVSEVSGKCLHSQFKPGKRESQAKIRSTTQRFCWITKPFCLAEGTTIPVNDLPKSLIDARISYEFDSAFSKS